MATYSIGRVSTAEQATDERTSLELQCRKCESLAVIADLPNPLFFADEGVSGSIPLEDRPKGGKVFHMATKGDQIIASKMDRIFRDAEDALSTSRRLKERGVMLYIADMGADPVNGEGGIAKLFFTILAAVAEFERWRIAERMQDAKRAKRAKGGHVGGSRPFGYRVEGKGPTAILKPLDDELAAISRAHDWAREGLSFREISKRLRAEFNMTISHETVRKKLAATTTAAT